jgi:hypothetical protein
MMAEALARRALADFGIKYIVRGALNAHPLVRYQNKRRRLQSQEGRLDSRNTGGWLEFSATRITAAALR